jgi:hypothetical protein
VKSVSVVKLLKAISHESSLQLFETIATLDSNSANDTTIVNSDSLMSKAKLSKKQYYLRLYGLTAAGLVQKSHGSYILTSLGIIVRYALTLIEKAVQNHWKLRSVDKLELPSNTQFPDAERRRLVDLLIDDPQLRQSLRQK